MKSELADLHRHLDGSIRPDTLHELATAANTEVPTDLVFAPGMGLESALARFAFTLSLLQDPRTVERVAHEICDDASADGVCTLEIRFAPQLHKGASISSIVDAALRGIDGRAGLILCGLYGEPPELLEHLVDVGLGRQGVVGLDLAGGPAPGHRWGMLDYTTAFKTAQSGGLGRTVHAGEGRPADEIRLAIEILHAQRIGHGLTVLDDPDLVELVREQNVTIEACPTSNWHVGAIAAIEDHPLPEWLEAGIQVCINTDNTLLSNTTSSREHALVQALPGVTQERFDALRQDAHAYQFHRQ